MKQRHLNVVFMLLCATERVHVCVYTTVHIGSEVLRCRSRIQWNSLFVVVIRKGGGGQRRRGRVGGCLR